MTTHPLPGGLLIAVEGIDGAGKTTVARAIADELRASAADVVLSKEPTNGKWGQKLRESALTGRMPPEHEAELLILDRREHVDAVIAPALEAGKVVILDRYFPSMVAYQGAEGLPPDELLQQNAFAPQPDLLLILDLPPETGLARVRARGDAPNQFETVANLTRCRAIFQSLKLPKTRTIDATQPLDEVIREAVIEVLRTLAGKAQAAYPDPVDAVAAISGVVPGIAKV